MGTGPRKHSRSSNKCNKAIRKSRATKGRRKDLDELQDMMAKVKAKRAIAGESLTAADALGIEYDDDLPGGGRFFCAQSGRHFMNQDALDRHRRTKGYKRRLRQLAEEQYLQAEAEAAVGRSTEKLPSAAESRARALAAKQKPVAPEPESSAMAVERR